MKLYILERKNRKDGEYDMNDKIVVCAKSPQAARKLAEKVGRDEGSGTWLSPIWSTCNELKAVRECVVCTQGRDG